MSKRKTVQAAAGDGSTPPQAPPRKKQAKRLTWRQERFVEAYALGKGNVSRAAREAGYATVADGFALLKNPTILAAIEAVRQEARDLARFDRERAIYMLLGIATARVSDFTEVLKNPEKRSSYRGLGAKEFGLASARTRVDEEGRVTNEINLVSAGERRAAINDLWDKLGLGKESGIRDRKAFLERFALLGAKLGRGGSGGGSASGDGS